MWFLALTLSLSVPMGELNSEIKEDEVVLFYPTYGRQVEDGRAWEVSIHGSIFEPEEGSLKRAVALDALRRVLGLSSEQTETRIFKRRARLFLVDNERGKTIAVRLGGRGYEAGTSAANGHFAATLRLSAAEVARLQAASDHPGWLTFRAVTRPDDRRAFTGRVQMVGPEGVSIISDIDDTIKISHVGDRRALIANTFLRKFEPVDRMAQLYREWAESGAVFHYLSASPWQLYRPLSEFLRAEGFPDGTLHLKQVRLKDASVLSLFGSQQQYKSAAIERILADFPRRRFVLVGDSGEQDPEIYGAAARKHPDQVVRILIRDVDGSGADATRYRAAFAQVPEDQWRIFKTVEDVHDGRPRSLPQD